MRAGRRGTVFAALVVVAALAAGAAGAAAPEARLTNETQLDRVYNQGIARAKDGWVLSGTRVLARADGRLRDTNRVGEAIPPDWAARGFNHIGDVDVAGRYVYVPFEQPDYERGEQAIARYDAKTLAFVDAVTVPQHEASFVTVDPKTMTAYSMDRFGGDALLRYDVRKGWKALPPVRMSQFVDRVQGGDVAAGVMWLSTDDDSTCSTAWRSRAVASKHSGTPATSTVRARASTRRRSARTSSTSSRSTRSSRPSGWAT
jgi:hypothetical protein